MFIGLTNKIIGEYNDIVTILTELGIKTLSEAELYLGDCRETFVLRVVTKVKNHPELDLWKQIVE